jgi:hypothetical protein
MKLEWLKVAVVIAAREHNPTVLHPAFLRAEGIVPEDWETAEDPVCTLAFATVTYRNQVRFAVEASRLQVSDTRPGADLAASPVAELATKYLQKLPHVRYTELEVRLQAFHAHPSPAELLIGRFLRPGLWNAAPLTLDSLGVRFEYTVERALLDLFLDAGSLQLGGEGKTGLIVNGVYSSELPAEQPIAWAVDLLRHWPDRCRHFLQTATTILGIGD